MKLGERVTYPGLEGVSLCGDIPKHSVCAQWLWWESWIWSEHVCIFPQGVLAATTFVGVRARVGGD